MAVTVQETQDLAPLPVQISCNFMPVLMLTFQHKLYSSLPSQQSHPARQQTQRVWQLLHVCKGIRDLTLPRGMGKASWSRTNPEWKLQIRPFILLDYCFFPISVLSVPGCFAAVSQRFRIFMAICIKKTKSANMQNPLLLTWLVITLKNEEVGLIKQGFPGHAVPPLLILQTGKPAQTK